MSAICTYMFNTTAEPSTLIRAGGVRSSQPTTTRLVTRLP